MKKNKILLITISIIISIISLGIFIILENNYQNYKNYENKIEELKLEQYYYPNYIVRDKTILNMKNDIKNSEERIKTDIEKYEELIKNHIGLKDEFWSKEIINSKKNDSILDYDIKIKKYYEELNTKYTKILNEQKDKIKLKVDTNKSLIQQISYYKARIKNKEQERKNKEEIKNNEQETKNKEEVKKQENKKSNNGIKAKYINGILLVNKTYGLPSTYNPGGFTSETFNAWIKMKEAAKKDGISLKIISGFRTYEYQKSTFNYWVNLYGEDYARKVSAVPGHSEHQTGMAMDIGGTHGYDLDSKFINTPEGKWLKKNSHKYGFIIRYPKDKINITKYNYEPWHVRYVGVSNATEMYNNNQCLEQYLGVA